MEGVAYPPGRAPYLVGTSCALRTPFSCAILLLVGKNSLYNLPKVLTTVSCKYILSLFRAVFLTYLDRHGVFKCPQCNAPRPLRQLSSSYSLLLPCLSLACCILSCHHVHGITTREKPSSSAGFGPISSAGAGATNKAL